MPSNECLPLSLRERLDDRREISTFEQWCHTESSPVHTVLPGFDTYYESQRAAFVSRQPYHDLEEIIAAYVRDNPAPDLDVKKCTWRDVLDVAQVAEAEYNRRDANSRTRSWIRTKGTTLASNLAPLKDLFPDEYGLTVVAGGLYLIFQGVVKIAENRDKIFQFFDQAPIILDQAEKTHRYLPHDTVLNDRLTELRTTVVLGLCGLLRILQPSHKRAVLQRLNLSKEGTRRLHSIFQTESTAHQIDEIDKALRDSKAKFDDCAEGLRTRILKETHHNSEESLRENKAVRETAHATLLEVKKSMNALHLDIKDLKASREQYAAGLAEAEQIQTKNDMFVLFQDALRCANVIFIERSSGIAAAIHEAEPTMQVEELLSMLSVDAQHAIDDLIEVVSQKPFLETDAAMLANGVLKDDRFRYWLAGPSSGTLLIEDFEATSRVGVYSPTAIFSGMLATGIPTLSRQDNKLAYMTCFFCSLHSDPADRLSGPRGMMRSLIYQLVHSVSQEDLDRINLSFIREHPHLRDDLLRHKIDALCHIYCTLVCQLSRRGMVFCIIDEISDMETETHNWRREICYVVEHLRQLACQVGDGRPAFKLCMTSSGRTEDICSLVAEDECVSPRAGLLAGSYITDATFRDGLESASSENYIMESADASYFGSR